MAQAFLPGIASEVLKKLGSAALDEIRLVWGFEDELSKFRDTVSRIQAVLLDAQKQQETNHQIKDWLEKLGDAFDDADNLLDEFFTEHLRRQAMTQNNKWEKKVRIFFSNKNQLAFRVKMAHKIKSIREKLDAIAKDRIQFNFIPQQVSTMPQVQVMGELDRETHGRVITEHIVGRNDDKHQIIKLLLKPNNQESVSIIPIVGIGGIGKTTLAQFVFNDESIVKTFEPKMWVCVSNVFNVNLIVKKMIESATRKKPKSKELDGMQGELQELITGKKYLLVLDDMWDNCLDGWSDLRSLLMGGARGSMILVTTRSLAVSERTRTLPLYRLENLSEDDAWLLFKRLAFKEDDELNNSWKLDMGRDIVKKCAQVPLAIKAVGSLLYIKDREEEWLYFKNNDLVNIAQEDGNVKIMQILRLSYDHLPLHLKPCFAYCSLYPKDGRIDKEQLIGLWIAQGFVKSLDGNQSLEDIGELYFIELLRRSFFQEVEEVVFDDNREWHKMHDLIHDLAQHVAGTECSSINSSSQITVTERTRHVFCGLNSFNVKSGQDDGKRMIYTAKKLRTFVGTCDHNQELKKICSTFKGLRVLVARRGGGQVDRVPDCMHKLKHLRYLHLSYTYQLTNLARSITRLPNLQSLILSGCLAREGLPSDIDKLINLSHLDLSSNSDLTNLPSSITRLQNLQTLKLGFCKLVQLPEDIDKLVNLRHLDLSDNNELSNLPSSIGGLQNLRSLLILGCLRLKELPRGISQLVSLRHLNNGYCCRLTDMGRGLGQLTGLRTLKKFVVGKEQERENGAGARVSELKGLNNLEGELSIERLERVSHVEIEQVNSSTHLLKEKQHLKNLQLSWKLETGPGCNGRIDAEDSERLLEGLQPHSNIQELTIDGYGGANLASWIGQLNFLQSLHIYNCKRLTCLSEGFQHLTGLRRLDIYNCQELDLCDDYNGMQFQGLTSLANLKIDGMPKLASLPVGLQHVTTLQRLAIYSCANLVTLPDWIANFQSLQNLFISDCPELTSLPVGLQHVTGLNLIGTSC